jgi:hypothetical protein
MPNNRVFWPIEQVALKDSRGAATGAVATLNSREFVTGPLASGLDEVLGLWEVPRGLQSAGMTTNFQLEQVFQLGQLELFEYSEREPQIEVTMSKVADGTKPLFFMVTDPAGANNIVSRTTNYRLDMTMQIYSDTQFRATGAPLSIVTVSGAFVSNISYSYPVDGTVTEDITIISNDKIWGAIEAISGITAGHNLGFGGEPLVIFPDDQDGGNPNAPEGIPSGVFGNDGNTSPAIEGGASELAGGADRFGVIVIGSGVQRREEVDIRRSVLPEDIPGVVRFVASGIDAAFVNGGFGAQGPGTAAGQTQLIGDANTDFIIEHIQNITLTFSVARNDIFELGRKRPFARVPDFALEATASFEVITSQGDFVDATSDIDCGANNTEEANTIIIRTCDGMQVDLGDRSRLQNVENAGGEAGGDNMTITYNYSSFNTFDVSHDFFQPNHRVLVFETGNSPFNVGAGSFRT